MDGIEKELKKSLPKATNNGRYKFSEDCCLGKGAFGIVVKALDSKQSDAVVAIKIVIADIPITKYLASKWKNKPASDEALVEIKKEAELLHVLQHNNIVGIHEEYEFKLSPTKICWAIVMDYCSGGNLQTRLETLSRDSQKIEVEKRHCWYKQLANALQFMHEQGVAHRDLKPPNILIDLHENLKIADVGVAKLLHGINKNKIGVDFAHYMQTLAGSPAYMAPEVWTKHYQISSDVFSLGLIMWVLCEIPSPPIPLAIFKAQSHCLGRLMTVDTAARSIPPLQLLNAPSLECSVQEAALFNDMLQYDFHNRPKMENVMKDLDDLVMKKVQTDSVAMTTHPQKTPQSLVGCCVLQ